MKQVIFVHDGVEYNTKINYNRRAKRVIFRVNGDELSITAPVGVSKAEIGRLLEENAGWIRERIGKRAKFENGVNVLFLGKPYKLHIIHNEWARAEEIGNQIVLFSPFPDDEEYNRSLYIEFLRHRAKVFLPEITAKMYPLVEALGADKPRITVRRARTRWGSCRSGSSDISLNIFLMNMPVECIEYVILHELVHILHPNHSAEFWNTLEKLMPDYNQRKEYIKNNIETEIMVIKDDIR